MSAAWPTTPPTFYDAMQLLKRDIFTSLNCMKIGQIQSYDPATSTAAVQVLCKRVLASGLIQDYPLLLDCPVFTLQGGGGAIQLPIAAGDHCLLIFSDRNLDSWFQTGAANPPPDGRCHDLSDAVALVGLNSLTNPAPTVPASTMRLAYGGALIDFTGGDLSLKSSGGAEFDVAGSSIAVKASGAEVDLSSGKVAIKNGTTDLKTLLDGLIDALVAATVQGPGTTYPLTSATIAVLNAYKTTLAGLLT